MHDTLCVWRTSKRLPQGNVVVAPVLGAEMCRRKGHYPVTTCPPEMHQVAVSCWSELFSATVRHTECSLVDLKLASVASTAHRTALSFDAAVKSTNRCSRQ